jgi:hypothetical protein
MTTTANGLLYGLGVQNCDELPADKQGSPILKGQVEKTSINLRIRTGSSIKVFLPKARTP